MSTQKIEQLIEFIENSPTAFHTTETIRERLEAEGFEELLEGAKWEITPGKKYYVTRNQTSIIAVRVGSKVEEYAFSIVATHSDSPTFKIKENTEISVQNKYTKLNTEGYGGMICSTWFDRPLSIAGRVIVKEGAQYHSRLVKIDQDLLMIPNLSIHMNRQINEGYTYNKQKDMLPVFSADACKEGAIKKMIAGELGVEETMIAGMDLFVYNRSKASVWGKNKEFVSAPRLDDLECAYTSLEGYLQGCNDGMIQVYACFDNEEVGSGTKQGAGSTFLRDVLERINDALGKTKEDYHRALAGSFMLSCDNAHAVHPNYLDKTDDTNHAYINDGIVIKSHAGQKYTSDGVSIAVFHDICEQAGAPVQFFANRSDMAGGSTLGNIAMMTVSMNCVDIGLAQWAMHSAYETAGVFDVAYMIDAITMFFNMHLQESGRGILTVTGA